MNEVSRYRKVYPRIWRHPGFRKLRPSTRELALYLLSGPPSNALGLFYLSPANVAEELGTTPETVRKGLADLAVTFEWQFDSSARVFYIPSWWRWNRPENGNVLKGNLKSLSEIPPCRLVDAFARNLETLPETMHATFIECCRIRLPKGPSIQEQEHLSGTHQEHVLFPNHEKDGVGKHDALMAIARNVLEMTDPNAPLEHLLDTFFALAPDSCTKPEATKLLNTALAERRGRWRPLRTAGQK